MNLSTIKSSVIFAANRGKLLVGKHSPEILTVVGIGAIVGSTVLACRATLKVNDILDLSKENSEKIHAVHNGEIDIPEDQTYSDEDFKRDIIVNKVQTIKNLTVAYLPAITLGALGIGCLLGAQGILRKRNVALLGALKACEQSFESYRSRVVEEFGKGKDTQLYYGMAEETTKKKVTDENGKKKTVTEKSLVINGNSVSQYARFFDEANENWSKNSEQNLIFLKQVQSYMNDLLISRGHVFLNEVYDALGLKRSEAGQLVGWVHGLGEADGFIDFGIFDADDEVKRMFVNGDETSILLDFNVDGVVYDLI